MNASRKPKARVGTDVPGRIMTTLTQRTKLGEFLHQWQEPVVWIPLLLGILFVLFYALPRLDPRTGIDGFGTVFQVVLQALVLAVACFCVWLFKRTYLRVLDEDEEHDLFEKWRDGDRRALLRLVFDRLEWLVLLCAALWYFGR